MAGAFSDIYGHTHGTNNSVFPNYDHFSLLYGFNYKDNLSVSKIPEYHSLLSNTQ